MVKQIGIRAFGVPSSAELLLFDEITLVARQATALKIETPEERAQIDYLAEKGVLVNAERIVNRPEVLSTLTSKLEAATGVVKQAQGLTGKDSGTWRSSSAVEQVQREDLLKGIRGKLEQLIALPYRQAIESHPDYEPTMILTQFGNLPSQVSDNPVLEVVINKLPVPAPDTPLDALLEFRSDDQAMHALRRIRRWMKKIAQKNSSAREIEEEFKELIDQYTEYMNVHKMKFQNSWFQTMISISLDLLDNLTRLRFKPAFDSLFALRAQRFALTEAELKAPGREAAYVVRVQEEFSS